MLFIDFVIIIITIESRFAPLLLQPRLLLFSLLHLMVTDILNIEGSTTKSLVYELNIL